MLNDCIVSMVLLTMLKVMTFSNEIYDRYISVTAWVFESRELSGETHLAGLVFFYQNFVYTKWAGTRWEAQYKGMRCRWGEVLDPLHNIIGNVDTRLLGVVTDNQPHFDAAHSDAERYV